MPNLTKDFVDRLKPAPGRDVFAWDDKLKGFGIRVKPSGAKAFLIQYRNRHGRSRRLTIGSYGTKTPDEARKRARQLLAAAEDGADPAEVRANDRAAMTVAALCDEYLVKAKAGSLVVRRGRIKKQSTVYTDAGRIERHIKPLLGNRAVKDLRASDVVQFRDHIIAGKTAANVKTKKRGRAIVKGGAGTAARTMGLLGGILAYAVSQGVREDNPARGVDRPTGTRRTFRLSLEGYRHLGKALEAAEAKGEPWQAIKAIRLLALTGCRRSEIERLRDREIDIAGGCLRLEDSKTGPSVRPVGSVVLDLLNDRPPGFVLPSPRGGTEPYRGLPNAWARIVKGGELDHLTPHGLRHSFASMAEDLGLTLPTIASLIGHVGRGSTGHYVHKVDSALGTAADKVCLTIWHAMTAEPEADVMPISG